MKRSIDIGLLVLRLGAGLMMAGHGLGKVMRLFAGQTEFVDPLGFGQLPSLILVAFAEFVCAVLVVVGFKTRISALPVVFAMLVAALVHHWNDAWGDKEFPLLYAAAFLTLVFTGAGKYSLDALPGRKR